MPNKTSITLTPQLKLLSLVLHQLTSGLRNAGKLLLIAGVKLEGGTWFQLSCKVPSSTGRSVAARAEVGVIAHLAILQERVKQSVHTANAFLLHPDQ